MKPEFERRNFFRINDLIGLTYSVIGDEEAVTSEGSDEMEIPLANLLSSIDTQFSQELNILWQENATAAQALGLLNRKISLLAAHLLHEDNGTSDSYEQMMANISGCGMAFHCTDPVPIESLLRVSVVLKPSNIDLHFTAKVVACERVSDIPTKNYLLRISIDEENHAVREQLVQHVVQRQSVTISNRS